MPDVPRLPVDEVLDDVVAALRESPCAVIIAPPGAGKTTRIPPALLASGLAGDGDILVIQPRRLAARMAARRVASELGQRVGQKVGYEVRFDRKIGPETRIRYLTEGVLTRKLLADPTLADTDIVVIDEFHERHLAGDLGLALLRQIQRSRDSRSGRRSDLRIAVMSATLDPGPVQQYLGDCPVIESAGRQFPVTVTYQPGQPDWRVEKRVSAALRAAVRDGLDGHVLVFLPGAAEIRRTREACAEIAERGGLDLVTLHGDLPTAEQDRAVAASTRRKVILATNVAETSITIDGVVCVIDAGTARVLRHSPWSGIPALRVEPISQASAAQRAGRAGRTRAGSCIRLYDQHDHDTRRAFDAPEIARADLVEAALVLYGAGVRDLGSFPWFEPPPASAIDAARELLVRLGAIAADRGGAAITGVGRRMLRFPVHPRQARILVEAEDRGVAAGACAVVALIGQKEIRAARRTRMAGAAGSSQHAGDVSAGPSDLLEDRDLLERVHGSAQRARNAGLDVAAALAVERSRKQLVRLVERGAKRAGRERGSGSAASPAFGSAPEPAEAEDQALLQCILTGYPDRVARRRRRGGADLVLAGGGSARLSPSSVVVEAEILVAIELDERGSGLGSSSVRVRRASAVRPEWLLDLYIDQISDSDELDWNPRSERVERVTRMTYDGLIIDESRDPGAARHDPEGAARILADAALAQGVDRFIDRFFATAGPKPRGRGRGDSRSRGRAELDDWRARLRFAVQQSGGEDLEIPDDDALKASIHQACLGLVSFSELERAPIMDVLRARLSHDQQRQVERLAPSHISLPGRRRVLVRYESDRPPWIESRMQDFFGLREGPAVAGGRVPLVLHLLAPNQRAVQVTSDLAGFWSRHYPELRRQLMRRYPRHAWPENPLDKPSSRDSTRRGRGR